MAVVLYISYRPVADDCLLFPTDSADGGRGGEARIVAALLASCLDLGPRTCATS